MKKILIISLIIFFNESLSCFAQSTAQRYRCKPCGLSCDSLSFRQPGECPHCQMPLMAEQELHLREHLKLNEIRIGQGSGEFLMEGGKGHEKDTIRVYYYRPKNFTAASPILLVIPGSGRNAHAYRDSWIEASNKWGVLVLSPQYAEQDYSFGAYQMGGLLYNMNLEQSLYFMENSNIVVLDEKKLRFKINTNPVEWIFRDFDRLFDAVVKATASVQTHYDIFGHSAGGQILHRLPLFHPHSKAKRILAANAGSYTLADFNTALPFGLKNSPIKEQDLKATLNNRLVLFLGAFDNEKEKGGLLLRSSTADRQGLHRLERGLHFFKTAAAKAKGMNTAFNWQLVVVPQTGHDYRKMGAAAAEYLYGRKVE